MLDTPVGSAIDWEDLYPKLYAYTDWLLRTKKWFRGKRSDVFLKGQDVEDYVVEAITRYLEHPEKFNANKRSLLGYLKVHIIRSLVKDDARLEENKLSKDVFAFADQVVGEGENAQPFLDTILPFAEALYDDELDYETVMHHLSEEVKTDPIVENIYLAVCLYGMKPREVMAEFSLTEAEYNNGFRRLKTILRNAATKFGIKSPSQ